MKKIVISAPGRICLFGEHQDYLQLPVIPMAINLRVTISGTPRNDQILRILLPDIKAEEILNFSNCGELKYTKERDYFRSIYNVLHRKGVRFEQGYNCVVKGNIPINSGTSSSSALNNVFCRFLLEAGKNVKTKWKEPEQVGHFSYEAEVLEFNEPGGMMDQLSTAVGNITFIDFANNNEIKRLPAKLETFVLGDSMQPKDTKGILSKTKSPALEAATKIRSTGYNFSFSNFEIEDIVKFKNLLSEKEFKVLTAMILNRDLTLKAQTILDSEKIDHKEIGKLLTEHHYYLDEFLNISTPKINKMLDSALKAGAYGGKINGSGGGGCMFAYAPKNPEKVAAAIENAGGKAYIISMDGGMK